jgi:4-amino-4-deoxy-L-arabinose transferase-like glycosyltransferase
MLVRDGLIAFGLFVLLLAGAAGWGQLGLYLLAWWNQRKDSNLSFVTSTAEKWYFSLVLGLGILAWLTLLLGLAKLLYPVTAWILIILGWMLGLALIFLWKQEPTAAQSSSIRKPPSELLQHLLAFVLILLAIGSLLYMLLAHTLMPPYEWDEIAYHLALAKIYVNSHGIVYVPYMVPSNWPMNTEMLFSLGLLLGSDVMAHLLTLFMSLWTAGGLYLVGKRFLDRRVGLLAAVLFLTTPLIKRLSGTGLNDGSLAFFGTAAIFAYAHYRQNRTLAWVGLSGLFSGLAAGCKLMGGAYPLFLGLLIILDARLPQRLAWRPLLARLSVFGGLGLLMVGPWYARSYAFTGNPIWPFLFQVFGGRNWDALGDEYHMQSLLKIWTAELSHSLKGFLDSLYYLFFEPERMGGYPGGFGYVTLALVALSAVLLAVLRRAPRLMYELLLFCGLFYGVWFLFVSLQVRYLIPILPALVLIAAFSFYFVWDRLPHRLLRWLLAGFLLFFLVRDFPWVDQGQRNFVRAQSSYLTEQYTRADFLEAQIDVMPAFQYINTHLPSDSMVLLLPYESRGYYLDRSYFWGHPISQRVIRFEAYDEPEKLAADLRALGITHILDNPHWLYTELRHWEHDRALMLSLEAACGEKIASWEDIILYRLVACRN